MPLMLLAAAPRAAAEVPTWVSQRLVAGVGQTVADELLLCESQIIDKMNCTIGNFIQNVAVRSSNLRTAFDADKRDAITSEEDCGALMDLLVTGQKTTRDTCLALAGQWPSDCVRVGISMTDLARDPSYEIGVVCRMVLFPTRRQDMPTCKDLMQATVAQYPTIREGNTEGMDCVANLCDVYGQFDWRARPYNLFEVPRADQTPKYEQSFVLPGCEYIDSYPFQPEQCHLRKDVGAFCGCVGDAVRWLHSRLDGKFEEFCVPAIEEYLVFGRLAHMVIRRDCVNYLCEMLGTFAAAPQCEGLDLPTKVECEAMQLDQVEGNCKWESDSGEVGVLECLDGTRCSLAEKGWPCCTTDHLGRGRCPREQPVMCDTLCSGTTEYCCEVQGRCTPRKCSPAISPKVMYLPITTTTLPTTPPPGVAGNLEGEPLDVGKEILTPGSGLFVLFVVLMLCCFLGMPIFLLACVVVLWQRLNEVDPPTPRVKLEEELDKNGTYFRVKPKPVDYDNDRKKPVVELIINELPAERPLGLELLETKVVRVHSLGKRSGFEVGDIIVEIAGVAVSTFEDVWQRIQIERDRCPVRFLVERCGDGAVPPEDIAALDADRAWREAGGGPRKNKDGKKSSKVGPPPLEAVVGKEVLDLPRSADHHWAGSSKASGLGPGLPSALVGWETWATPPQKFIGEDEGATSCTSSPPRSPLRQPKAVHDRQNIVTTRFMRSFPVTAAAKLQTSMKSRKAPARNEVRFVRDAWGRHVATVDGQMAPKTGPTIS